MTELPGSRQVLVDLVGQIKKTGTDSNAAQLQRRLGQVTAFNGADHTFTVAIGGDTDNAIAGIRCLSNYFPAIGQVVWLDIKQGDATIIGDATPGPWIDWTPTLSSFSPGSITKARYTRRGQTVTFEFNYLVSGAGSGTTPWHFTPPFTPSYNTAGSAMLHLATLYSGASSIIQDDNKVYVSQSASIAANGLVSPTTPATWQSGDTLYVSGTYEVATGS